MILRSGKSLGKRPKLSSADDVNELDEKDFISRLPDTLLVEIVTLLPKAEANRTCILSHRWNPIRAFLPDLRIVMPVCESYGQVRKFHDSVDQTLAIRHGSTIPIQKFFFDASQKCDYYRVHNLLCTVVKCQVKEMELSFLDDLYKVRLCWDMFRTCETLVNITLKGGFVLRVPEKKPLFPCLKQMKLFSIRYSSKMALQNLISGCPSLEELFVERNEVLNDGLHSLKVSSPTLKILIIFSLRHIAWENKVVIDAPNLKFLYLLDHMILEYSMKKQSSLMEARICSSSKSVAKLLRGFASIKALTLGRGAVMTLKSINRLNIPMFDNMSSLVISTDCMLEWDFLRHLLYRMPNLECLTIFGFSFQNSNWNNWNPPEDAQAPPCLHSKVKEIRILDYETVTEWGVIFIIYLLKHSYILEELMIKARVIDPYLHDLIMNYDRSSVDCQIVFI